MIIITLAISSHDNTSEFKYITLMAGNFWKFTTSTLRVHTICVWVTVKGRIWRMWTFYGKFQHSNSRLVYIRNIWSDPYLFGLSWVNVDNCKHALEEVETSTKTVEIHVPDVDHSHRDAQNLLAIVFGIDSSRFYKLANKNKYSTFKQLYTTYEFIICKEKLRWYFISRNITERSSYN